MAAATASERQAGAQSARGVLGEATAILDVGLAGTGGPDLSSYFGSSGTDLGGAVAVDGCGAIWVVGRTDSPAFPILNAFQPAFAGGYTDAFVARFDAAGRLSFSTYLGGGDPLSADWAVDVAVDSDGYGWVVGNTDSASFPTRNPTQPGRAGGTDGFVARFGPDGTLLFSSYFGGTENDYLTAVAVNDAGDALVGGMSDSLRDFPVRFPLQAAGGMRDGVAAVFASDGTLRFATLLGGLAWDMVKGVASAPDGGLIAVGTTASDDFPTQMPVQQSRAGSTDAFVVRVASDTSRLEFATFLGGTADDTFESVAVDDAGLLLAGGETMSSDYPVVRSLQPGLSGASDLAVSAIDLTTRVLLFSTTLGGSGSDRALSAATMATGTFALSDATESTDFPVWNAFDLDLGGTRDAFILTLNTDSATIGLSSYLGGTGNESVDSMAVDYRGAILVGGTSDSLDYPLVDPVQPGFGGGATDVFLTRIGPGGYVPPPLGNVLWLSWSIPSGAIHFTWTDVPGASSYVVLESTVKGAPFNTPTGRAASGNPGPTLPAPLDPLVHFRVAGENCGVQGDH